MQVTWNVTRKHLWTRRWRTSGRSALRLALVLFALPFVTFGVCRLLRLDSLLTIATAAVMAIVPVASLPLLLKDLGGGLVVLWSKEIGTYTAEISKFDLRWGRAEALSYCHHWSYFHAISEAGDDFCFTLQGRRPLLVPNSACPNAEAAAAFLAEARRCWQDALARQQERVVLHDSSVWPPAPRLPRPPDADDWRP